MWAFTPSQNGHCCNVTFSGRGGIGKTRLALAAARRLLPEFADGVWFAALAPLSEPTLVPAEHVIGGAGTMAEAILHANSAAHVVATSREPIVVSERVLLHRLAVFAG
jgi:predicted ATPase